MKKVIQHHIYIIPLVLMAIFFIAPSVYAVTNPPLIASDDTICDTVVDNECLDAEGVSHGPPLSPELSAVRIAQIELNNLDLSSYVSEDGLFSCSSADSGEHGSVGTLVAIGDSNVPVFDAAVTLNTGYLVYKECILDGLIVKARQDATAKLVRAVTNLVNTGDNGRPLFQTDPAADRSEINRRVTEEFTKNYNTEALLPAFRDEVVSSVITNHLNPTPSYGYTREDEELVTGLNNNTLEGRDVFRGLLSVARNPSNSPLFAALNYRTSLEQKIAQEQIDFQTQVNNGGGFKPVQTTVQVDVGNGETADRQITVTPGSIVEDALKQALGSGFRQLENAREVDEIVNSTFASLQTQILSSPQGLKGVSEKQAGQEFSFIDALVNIASSIFGSASVNYAISILNPALATEVEFYKYRFETLTFLNEQNDKILKTQGECIAKMETSVKSISGSVSITIPTEVEDVTLFINGSVGPLRKNADKDVQVSTTTISVLRKLIDYVTNSNSSSLQKVALSQLDALIAAKVLHNANDVEKAKKTLTSVSTVIDPLVDATISAWATTTVDSSGQATRGWCNTNDNEVVQSWFAKWRN